MVSAMRSTSCLRSFFLPSSTWCWDCEADEERKTCHLLEKAKRGRGSRNALVIERGFGRGHLRRRRIDLTLSPTLKTPQEKISRRRRKRECVCSRRQNQIMGRWDQPLVSAGHTDTLSLAGPSVNTHTPSSVGSLCIDNLYRMWLGLLCPTQFSLVHQWWFVIVSFAYMSATGLAAHCCIGLPWIRIWSSWSSIDMWKGVYELQCARATQS